MAVHKLENLSYLMELYNLEELKVFRREHLLKFVKTHQKKLEAEGVPEKWLNLAMASKNILKADLKIICAIPFATKATYFLFLESIPDDVRVVFEALLIRKMEHESLIEKETKISVTQELEQRNRHYSRPFKTRHLLNQFATFLFDIRASSEWSPSTRKYWLGVPFPLKVFLLQEYYEVPDNARLIPQEDQNPEGPMLFSQKSAVVLSDVESMKVFALQGGINIGTRGKMSVPSVRKAQRQLNIEEFFPNSEVKPMANLRTTFLMCIMNSMTTYDLQLSNHELLRSLLLDYLVKEEPVINLLAYFKGIGVARLQDYIDHEATGELVRVLKKLPQGKWVSTSNILKHLQYFHIDTEPIVPGAAIDYLSIKMEDAIEPWGRYNSVNVTYENYLDLIDTPFVKGMFFFFAAAGVLDICYQVPSNTNQLGITYNSPYDSVFSVRLTELGAYLLGMTKVYTPPESVAKTKLQFVEDALVITADREDEITNLLLEPFTSRIGPARYMTDFSTFLHGCKTSNDIQNKINLFRSTVQNELPPNWEAFLTELKGKIDPFDIVNKHYTVYRIPAENKALTQLIARDEVLKKIVLKAENFHILVPVVHASTFKKRLVEFGYMLT